MNAPISPAFQGIPVWRYGWANPLPERTQEPQAEHEAIPDYPEFDRGDVDREDEPEEGNDE